MWIARTLPTLNLLFLSHISSDYMKMICLYRSFYILTYLNFQGLLLHVQAYYTVHCKLVPIAEPLPPSDTPSLAHFSVQVCVVFVSGEVLHKH